MNEPEGQDRPGGTEAHEDRLARIAPARWLAAGAIGLGVLLVLIGLIAALSGGNDEGPSTLVESPIRTIATSVSSTATLPYANSERHLVQLNGGRLLALLRQGSNLYIASDETNAGRAWTGARAVEGLQVKSFAATADGQGNLHLAYSDGEAVFYARLSESKSGWTVSATAQINVTPSPIVDITWDRRLGLAHLAWVKETPEGPKPAWSAVAVEGDSATKIDSHPVATGGRDVPVLVNVGVSGDSDVIVTYRRSDSPQGWYSRSATYADGEFAWGKEESLPVHDKLTYASLAVARGVPHLVLEKLSGDLVYLTRTDRNGWSAPQTAVHAAGTTIGFPSLTVDVSSRLVYLFFQSSGESSQVDLAIRDPATGWEGPYAIARPDEIPEGARYPSVLQRSEGQPIVLWTTGGDEPSVQAARVAAP